MFFARVLVVSPRPEVAAELDPLIRESGHLALAVADEEEALHTLDEGIVPDVVISDAAAGLVEGTGPYLRRFRQLNRFGQHLRLGTPGAEQDGDEQTSFATLPWPIDADAFRESLDRAIDQIRRDLQLQRGEMFRETGRLQQAIRDAQLEMVTALAVTMEAKDPYMQGHCARVAELAARVAQQRGLPEEAQERVRTAALLHEIGKISVPLSLLHEPGALTEQELGQVRAHTEVGGQVLGAIPSLRGLVPLIQTQYTDHAALAAQLTPGTEDWVLAGILRVVDTFDAMTSDRSYRTTLSDAAAREKLRQGAGSSFDPQAVDAFFRAVPPAGTD